MLATAQSYGRSFFVEGLKYYDPIDPHRVKVVFSTASSNLRSRYAHGLPFLSMDVWRSWAEGHTRGEGKGMATTPGDLDTCSYEGTVADHFKYLEEDFAGMSSLEDLMSAAGIDSYVRFIAGYDIHGGKSLKYGGRYCALDWYAQNTADRRRDPEVWEHWLILDEVCPTEVFKAEEYQRMKKPFRGWGGHRIGGGQ